MPAVDHERVLLKVKAEIASRPSHGRDQLLSRIAQIEVTCEVPEEQEGFDGVPVRRQLPVEQHDDDSGAEQSLSNDESAQAAA